MTTTATHQGEEFEWEKQMYILKAQASIHLKNKMYSHAMVYLKDVIALFEKAIENGLIHDQTQMERLIREVKLSSHKNLSLCYLKQGNHDQCIKNCEAVLAVESNSVKILYRMGISYINLGDLISAEKHLKKAYLIAPDEKEVMKALERI